MKQRERLPSPHEVERELRDIAGSSRDNRALEVGEYARSLKLLARRRAQGLASWPPSVAFVEAVRQSLSTQPHQDKT